MIAGLIGEIYRKGANFVLINVGGVIYEVFVSLPTLARLDGRVELLTTQIVREDGISLYGFLERNEKEVFEILLKISGIGPKVAMMIVSAFEAEEFARIVHNNDFASLKKVPGIGEKIAKRIIVEISGKLENIATPALPSAHNEALQALESLGFKTSDILPLLQNARGESSAEIVKEVLKSFKR